jgi:DNA-3-methyladenine glycosylase II
MVEVACLGPFDLGLSLQAARSFARGPGSRAGAAETDPVGQDTPEIGRETSAATLRLAVRLEDRPTMVEVRQTRPDPAALAAESRPVSSPGALRALVARVVNADLDLRPFYALVVEHPVMGPLTGRFHGLKPFRPADLFDMLVTAVVEQQISLAAAGHIRSRLVERFGEEVEGIPVFPRPGVLAETPLEALKACGLSLRKAGCVSGVAREVATGALDLEELQAASAEDVRTRITALRGFGPWSADYVLVRGLGLMDVVPTDDLGIRSALGEWLGDGRRLTPGEAEQVLAPFAPYRGLAAFYLLVAGRLRTYV